MVDLGLPLHYVSVKVNTVVDDQVSRFQPSTVLASTSGGDIHFGGALSGLLQRSSSIAETGQRIDAN